MIGLVLKKLEYYNQKYQHNGTEIVEDSKGGFISPLENLESFGIDNQSLLFMSKTIFT